MVGIEEGSIEAHLEEIGRYDLWSSNLGVVSSDTSKEWNFLLDSIELKIVVNGGLNHGLCGRFNHADDLGKDAILEEWDQDLGNRGTGTTT